MKRHLIWIIAGTAAIGIAVPAFAAVQPSATPEDNGTPGEVRGNCDEPEHANDPECRTVTVAAPSASTTPTTIAITVPSVSAPSTTTVGTVPSTTTGNTVADNTVPGNTVPDNTVAGTVPDNTVATSVPGDISGPCDEAEHANDPRCTGAASGDDQSGRDGSDDNSGDDSGHHSGGDDSGHGGGDD